MVVRSLQRQRHEIQKRLSEAHQQELGELKLGVSRSTDMIFSLQERQSSTNFAISAKENTQTEAGQVAKNDCKRLKKRCDAISYAMKSQESFRAQIKAPSWLLFTNTLNTCFSRAEAGWKFAMTAYRVVPDRSELPNFIINNNLRGLQEFFKQKKASPFDKIEFRWSRTQFTLLEVSELYPYNEPLNSQNLVDTA